MHPSYAADLKCAQVRSSLCAFSVKNRGVPHISYRPPTLMYAGVVHA